MIYKLLCLTFALALSRSAAQTLTVISDCIKDGATVTLRCDTFNFSSPILFYLGTSNKGSCTSGVCGTIGGYKLTQLGTFTDLEISAYDHSNDGGNWTCNYGSSTSNTYTVEPGSCKSPDSPKIDTTIIVVGVVSSIVVLAIFGLIIYFKVYKRKVQKTPVVKGTQLVPSVQKTLVVTDTQLVPSVQKTPVVTGMPLEPEGPLKIKTRQDHVEFQWKPPKSDGGSAITGYIVEVNGIKFDTWETFAKSSSMKLKVPMEKFKDGKVMSFRVRAENEYGLSEPLSAQKPFTLQNSHDLLANRPVVTNQGRGHDGESSLLEQVPIDRTLPKPV